MTEVMAKISQISRDHLINKVLVDRAVELLKHVEFMHYLFTVGVTGAGEVYLRGEYMEADTYTGKEELQLTRRWLLNPAMTDSEIVSTVFKCAITSMEHRTREAFKYRGARIYGPHFHVDDLVRLCKEEGRENAGGRDAAP